MSVEKAAWLRDIVGRRIDGVEGRRREIRARYECFTGRPWPEGGGETLTDVVFGRLDEANARRDTSLAPYVDKYRVREYVAETVGRHALVPLLWSGINPLAIPVGRVEGILKTNHMSQAVLRLRRDSDPWMVRRRAARWMAENYYWVTGEYQYRAIRPRLLVEHELDDGTEYGPRDYSLWCVHGEPLFCQVRDTSRELRQAYSLAWEPLPGVLLPGARTIEVPRPEGLAEMTAMARALAAPFSFVRADFYDVGGRVYFGELTFSPAAGRLRLRNPDLDRYLGHLVRAGAAALPGAHARIARYSRAAAVAP
ncbi:MAG: ATP-grasp fold amidoligase family protein [Mobilicoccus sp.]|nr:ATP-grasp fold amidoligase family protein [Mobilicoccus sp.]